MSLQKVTFTKSYTFYGQCSCYISFAGLPNTSFSTGDLFFGDEGLSVKVKV